MSTSPSTGFLSVSGSDIVLLYDTGGAAACARGRLPGSGNPALCARFARRGQAGSGVRQAASVVAQLAITHPQTARANTQ